MEISVEELNELLEKEFERGKQSVKDNNPFKLVSFSNEINYIPESCKSCPNHPSNGGSGICHCILGNEIRYEGHGDTGTYSVSSRTIEATNNVKSTTDFIKHFFLE